MLKSDTATGSSKDRLASKLDNRTATVAVVGLGYVGLPLAIAFVNSGFRVVGLDISKARIDQLRSGVSPVEDVPNEVVAKAQTDGRLHVTTDFAAVAGVDATVVAVPTPIDEHRVPDLSAVKSAIAALTPHVKPGSLIVLESTSYPGTTQEVVVSALRARGLSPGQDIFVGYSPERIDPRNQTWRIENTPKVVAGLTVDCRDLVIALYSAAVERLVPVSTMEAAEITKLFENIFRIVNIALVNEFQIICDAFGIDVWEVLTACSTKPYGFMPFLPGPGLGGHCVPVDPFYLAWKAREKGISTEFIELAGKINAQMPMYVVGRVATTLNGVCKPLNGARVALVGVAYKKNVGDMRESAALVIVELLAKAGAVVSYHDPHVGSFDSRGTTWHSVPLTPDYLSSQDCVLIVTDHDAIDWATVKLHATLVVDTRNALARVHNDVASAH